MPSIGSIGWINVQGASAPSLSHNASTIDTESTVPAGHYALLFGPITVAEGTTFAIADDAQVKIKAFADA